MSGYCGGQEGRGGRGAGGKRAATTGAGGFRLNILGPRSHSLHIHVDTHTNNNNVDEDNLKLGHSICPSLWSPASFWRHESGGVDPWTQGTGPWELVPGQRDLLTWINRMLLQLDSSLLTDFTLASGKVLQI